MVGLLDIAPSTRTVSVGGADIAVFGVSAHGIAYLITRFPELREMVGEDLENISSDTIAKTIPDAIAAIISAGCGYPNNAEAEAQAARLSADAQLDLLSAIIELTLPKGVGPFLEKFNGAMRVLSVTGNDPPMPSPSPLSN